MCRSIVLHPRDGSESDKSGPRVDLSVEKPFRGKVRRDVCVCGRRARSRLKGYRRTVARKHGRFLITRPVEGYPLEILEGRNMQITGFLRPRLKQDCFPECRQQDRKRTKSNLSYF